MNAFTTGNSCSVTNYLEIALGEVLGSKVVKTAKLTPGQQSLPLFSKHDCRTLCTRRRGFHRTMVVALVVAFHWVKVGVGEKVVRYPPPGLR